MSTIFYAYVIYCMSFLAGLRLTGALCGRYKQRVSQTAMSMESVGAARTCSACPTALVGGILNMAVLTYSFDS